MSPIYRFNRNKIKQARFMGRKSGASAFKPRPTTRKQRKKYNRRNREVQVMINKHSIPGSKAGPRKEWTREKFNLLSGQLKDFVPASIQDNIQESTDYDMGDAILDDLFNNSKDLKAIDNPQPEYLSNQYLWRKRVVRRIMVDYWGYHDYSCKKYENRFMTPKLSYCIGVEEKSEENKKFIYNKKNNKIKSSPLPTEKQLSLLLRSFRDFNIFYHSKRPGLSQTLHLLKSDLNIPTSILSEYSYNSFLSCCENPYEIKTIFKLMDLYGVPLGSYAYSILVDIYAEKGDYRAIIDTFIVMRIGRIYISLAAYTSLLKGCYRLISRGDVGNSLKNEAGNVAWNAWKELRINGLEPDAMTYGAIIRIMAAQGLPERAVNLIEEMQHFEIKPTTLIFSSALHAISRSLILGLRFEVGKERKDKRNEQIISHHASMTREVLILSEESGVDQNNGFISALMNCVAISGDVSTVKAIYLASVVKRHIEYLKIEQEKTNLTTLNDGFITQGLDINIPHDDMNNISTVIKSDEKVSRFSEKEKYGTDTRMLTAILHANANALVPNGLGNLWCKKRTKGYLDISSLRLLTSRYKPQYVDKSIPGMSGTMTGLSSINWDIDLYDSVKVKNKLELHKKTNDTSWDQSSGNRMDEIHPDLYTLLEDDFFNQNNWNINGSNNSHSRNNELLCSSKEFDKFSPKEMTELENSKGKTNFINKIVTTLPDLPKSQIAELRNTFTQSIGAPSLLTLVKILREENPEVASMSSFKQKIFQDAQFIIRGAEIDGNVDIHILNSMLLLYSKHGSLDMAHEFIDLGFTKYEEIPNLYSHRIIIQMLVRNNRIACALDYKEKLESQNITLDLHAYGILIEYYGYCKQLGSALLTLRECIDVHGCSPPRKKLKRFYNMLYEEGQEEFSHI